MGNVGLVMRLIYFIVVLALALVPVRVAASQNCELWGTGAPYKIAKFYAQADRSVILECINIGKDVNAKGGPLHYASILHRAAWLASPEVVEALIEKGANLRAKTRFGDSVLHYAARNRNSDVLRLLLKVYGPSAATVKNDKMQTPLKDAVVYGNTEALKILLEAGATIVPGESSPSAIHLAAAEHKNSELFQLLVDAGIDVNLRDANGNTPLHWAAARGNTALAAAAIRAGANVDTRNVDGWTPLHDAAGYSKTPNVIDLLLDAGADVAARNAKGQQPFDLAEAREEIRGTDAYWRLNPDCSMADWTGVVRNVADLFECDEARAIRSLSGGRKLLFRVGAVSFLNSKYVTSMRMRSSAVEAAQRENTGDSGFSWSNWNTVTQATIYTVQCSFSSARGGTLKNGSTIEVSARLVSYSQGTAVFDCS